MKSNYQPINCNYYDRLEAWATTKKNVRIIYMPEKEQVSIEGIITDFHIKDGAEYLTLHTGLEIRLDWLIAVDGIPLPNSC